MAKNRKEGKNMILDRRSVNEIERHLYGWQRERKLLDELKNEIAEAADFSMDLAKPTNRQVSDTTGRRAAQMERDLWVMHRWVRVVEAVRARFLHTPMEKFLTMVYVEHAGEVAVCKECYISRRTFFRWKKDVIYYAALKACEYGVLAV
jgi:hypothetical protein